MKLKVSKNFQFEAQKLVAKLLQFSKIEAWSVKNRVAYKIIFALLNEYTQNTQKAPFFETEELIKQKYAYWKFANRLRTSEENSYYC